MVDPNLEKTIRVKIFETLTKVKKIKIKYGEELRNGISDCLQEELGVTKDTLSVGFLKGFDKEVDLMYNYLPRRIKKFGRNQSEVVRKSRDFFSRKIELVEIPEDVQIENVEVEIPEVQVGGIKLLLFDFEKHSKVIRFLKV